VSTTTLDRSLLRATATCRTAHTAATHNKTVRALPCDNKQTFDQVSTCRLVFAQCMLRAPAATMQTCCQDELHEANSQHGNTAHLVQLLCHHPLQVLALLGCSLAALLLRPLGSSLQRSLKLCGYMYKMQRQ
jgi:hypothetical protein